MEKIRCNLVILLLKLNTKVQFPVYLGKVDCILTKHLSKCEIEDELHKIGEQYHNNRSLTQENARLIALLAKKHPIHLKISKLSMFKLRELYEEMKLGNIHQNISCQNFLEMLLKC
jgi:hypothetical protein